MVLTAAWCWRPCRGTTRWGSLLGLLSLAGSAPGRRDSTGRNPAPLPLRGLFLRGGLGLRGGEDSGAFVDRLRERLGPFGDLVFRPAAEVGDQGRGEVVLGGGEEAEPVLAGVLRFPLRGGELVGEALLLGLLALFVRVVVLRLLGVELGAFLVVAGLLLPFGELGVGLGEGVFGSVAVGGCVGEEFLGAAVAVTRGGCAALCGLLAGCGLLGGRSLLPARVGGWGGPEHRVQGSGLRRRYRPLGCRCGALGCVF